MTVACLWEQPHLQSLVKLQYYQSSRWEQSSNGVSRQIHHHFFLESWRSYQYGCNSICKSWPGLAYQVGVAIVFQTAEYQWVSMSRYALDTCGWMELCGEFCHQFGLFPHTCFLKLTAPLFAVPWLVVFQWPEIWWTEFSCQTWMNSGTVWKAFFRPKNCVSVTYWKSTMRGFTLRRRKNSVGAQKTLFLAVRRMQGDVSLSWQKANPTSVVLLAPCFWLYFVTSPFHVEELIISFPDES